MAMDFDTDAGAGHRARLGLVVLQTDETLEAELARLPAELSGISLLHTRIPSAAEVTVDSLAQMHRRLPDVVRLLPRDDPMHVIGYGCTSGATIIGEQAVATAIQSVHPGVTVTNPLTALKAACEVLNIRSLGLITPYELPVTEALAKHLGDHGIEIPCVESYEQTSESVVARISPASLLKAVAQTASRAPDCDAWFVSCTNLRMAGITDAAEKAIGKPVLSSNQVLAWHMLRAAQLPDTMNNWGQLFER
jgi:maleate isomerase